METVFLLAGAQRRARDRPRSATRKSKRNKADRYAPTPSHKHHLSATSKAARQVIRQGFNRSSRRTRAARETGPSFEQERPRGRVRLTASKRPAANLGQTTMDTSGKTRRVTPRNASEILGKSPGRPRPRDRHPQGRRQRGWLRAQHRARSALPKGQEKLR